MIQNEKQMREESLVAVARCMMTAARTAPKARGVDNLEVAMVTGSDLLRLSERMADLGVMMGKDFFVRDAAGVANAGVVVLIGTRHAAPALGLNCGYCGWSTCGEKPSVAPCFFHAHDLGLAIGSAVSVAADHRVDSRVMFSVGYAAREMGMLSECATILGIPVTASGKNPYFDRVANPVAAK